MKPGIRGYVLWGILGLAFANWALWGYVLEGNALQVTFFDVGQGDAIFIETPEGHQIVIDGGPSRKVTEKVGRALPFWDKSIDLLILTHPDADHITGLVAMLERYDVENVLWTGVESNTNIFAAWSRELEEQRAHIILARAPQRVVWSRNSPYAFLDILYPDIQSPTFSRAKSGFNGQVAINDTSIVSKLVFGSHAFLFPGDITKLVEQKLVDRQVDLRSNVLKAAHHGSKSSSSGSFLEAVAPSLAVIQVGANNRHGHPAPEVLKRFADFGIPVLRTDQNGDIVVRTDGAALQNTDGHTGLPSF